MRNLGRIASISVGLAALDGCPQRSCYISIWWTVESDIEEDVQVEEKALHRYFRLRCRRCASAGTPRAAPRSIRSTGVWSSVLGGFDSRSRYRSTRRETDVPLAAA